MRSAQRHGLRVAKSSRPPSKRITSDLEVWRSPTRALRASGHRAIAPRHDVAEITFDTVTLEALLALVRAPDRADAEVHAARLRTLLGAAGTRFSPHIGALIARAAELQRTQHLAMTDALTKVANRRALRDALRRELARAQRSRSSLALLMLDVDGFKAINDQLGHAHGDQALQLLARCLRRVTRQGDLVARIGGDEFALMLPETSAPEARAIGERIRAQLARAGDSGVRIEVSIGCALAEPGTSNPTALLAAADQDLYRDKNSRRQAAATAVRRAARAAAS
jgi:diguanylate cyclase (GGDEF)-like protein